MIYDRFFHKIDLQGTPQWLHITASIVNPLFCSYSVKNNEGYLFTLVPSDCPFADLELCERDAALNYDVNWAIFECAKNAIINHYM